MGYETIIVEKEDQIATITLNRPETLNAINPVMHYEMDIATKELAQDTSVKVVIITGAGRGFCSGADRNPGVWNIDTAEAIRQHTLNAGKAMLNIWEMEKPVIAAVNGAAAGGGFVLALACDVVIASDKAKFTQIYSRIGATPDMGATYLLPRVVGMVRASDLLLTGRIIDAHEAERLGVVSQVVPHESLANVTRELAVDLAERSAICGLTKKTLHSAMALDLRGAIDLEAYVEVLGRGNAESLRAWGDWKNK